VASVLIVDDDGAVRDLMARWVSALGLRAETASSATEALTTLRARHYDLAVIDVMMPGHDGLWLTEQLRRDYPHTAVVIATGYIERLEDACARQHPAADLLANPFPRERFVEAVDRGRHWRRQALDDLWEHARLSLELGDRVNAISGSVRTLTASGMAEADVLTAIAAERSPEIIAHGERVARYAVAVARDLGMDARQRPALAIAARFHDVGKTAMPRALLLKPSALTPGERAIMRRHVEVGADLLAGTRTLCDAAPFVRASHEWFGGGGHPERLTGSDIPLGSRVITVVDAFDTMTHPRPYKMRVHSADAAAELFRCTPSQFDPDVVGAFLELRRRN
jgi:putative two-component system response regulator